MNDDRHSKKEIQTSCWKKHGQDGQHQSLSDSGSPQKEKVGQLHVPAQRESGKTSSFNKILAKKSDFLIISSLREGVQKKTFSWDFVSNYG